MEIAKINNNANGPAIINCQKRCYNHTQFQQWVHTYYHKPTHTFCVVYSTGAMYRFNGSNPCNHTEAGSDEVDKLRDGDLFSCALRNDNVLEFFGLFLNTKAQRQIVITVIGSHMNCSPVDGLKVTLFSISHKSYICKAMLSHSADRCQYQCSCKRDDVCSHVVIGIPSVHGGDLCEVVIDKL